MPMVVEIGELTCCFGRATSKVPPENKRADAMHVAIRREENAGLDSCPHCYRILYSTVLIVNEHMTAVWIVELDIDFSVTPTSRTPHLLTYLLRSDIAEHFLETCLPQTDTAVAQTTTSQSC
jgi:hypothetical protein